MEFVKGKYLIFNAQVEDYRYTKGKEYEVVGVERNIIIVLDDNNHRVAWTKKTASDIFIESNRIEYAQLKQRAELLEGELTSINNTLCNVTGKGQSDNKALRQMIERIQELLGDEEE